MWLDGTKVSAEQALAGLTRIDIAADMDDDMDMDMDMASDVDLDINEMADLDDIDAW